MTVADPARTMFELATRLAREGFRVLPLQGKVPYKGTAGSKDATSNLAAVSDLWIKHRGANVGIATGQGLVVIDVDGAEGRSTFELLVEEHGEPPPTMRVSTGRADGGVHHYYTLPAGVEVRNAQARRAEWAGIDVRGEGGYVVAAGSVHPDTGAVYALLDDQPLAELSGPWLAALTAPRARASTTTPNRITGEKIPQGERHQTWISRIGKLIDDGHTREEVLALMRELNKRSEAEATPDETVVRYVDDGFSRWTATKSVVPSGETPDVHVARSVAASLADRLKDDPLAVFNKDVVAALATIRDDPAEWAPVAMLLRKSGQVREVDKAIKRCRAELAQAKLEAMRRAPMDDEPISLIIPERYEVNETGVWYLTGEDALERILHVPLYITSRLKDVDDDSERIALSWKRDGAWHSTNCDASLVASAQRVVALADHGLPVNSQTAGAVVRYLTELAGANPEIPVRRRSERTGWIGSSHFLPGAEGEIEFDPRDQSLKSVLTPVGTLEEWAETAGAMREAYPLLRLQLSASFSGPLLQRTGSRAFVVHLWGDSGSGKTASMAVAASVWGGLKYMKSFMTTPYALTVNAAERTGLPLCINEKQLWTGYTPVDRVIYELVEGVSKGQGQKDGGTRAQLRWLCPILTNGESPISTDDSEQGVRTRALEIAGEPIDSEAVASSLYDFVLAQHGTAGPEFVRRILEIEPSKMREDLAGIQAQIDQAAGEGTYIKTHLRALGVICLADFYSSMFVFGQTPTYARDASLRWAVGVLTEHLQTRASTNQGATLYEHLCGEIRSVLGIHIALEKGQRVDREDWGYLEDGYAWIVSSAFKNMVATPKRGTAAGIRWLGSNGFLMSWKNGKDVRYTKRVGGSAAYYGLKYEHMAKGTFHGITEMDD